MAYLFLARGEKSGLQSTGLYKTNPEILSWLEKSEASLVLKQGVSFLDCHSVMNWVDSALGMGPPATFITECAHIPAWHTWNITVPATKQTGCALPHTWDGTKLH